MTKMTMIIAIQKCDSGNDAATAIGHSIQHVRRGQTLLALLIWQMYHYAFRNSPGRYICQSCVQEEVQPGKYNYICIKYIT